MAKKQKEREKKEGNSLREQQKLLARDTQGHTGLTSGSQSDEMCRASLSMLCWDSGKAVTCSYQGEEEKGDAFPVRGGIQRAKKCQCFPLKCRLLTYCENHMTTFHLGIYASYR